METTSETPNEIPLKDALKSIKRHPIIIGNETILATTFIPSRLESLKNEIKKAQDVATHDVIEKWKSSGEINFWYPSSWSQN